MKQKRDITALLDAWGRGDSNALDALSPLIYEELRRLAARAMQSERPGHTLQATAVVHEAFVRLVEARVDVENRRHFYALAARTMRRVLVDHARTRRRDKRGGGARGETLDTSVFIGDDHAAEVLELDDALEKLAQHDAELARAVELIYFGGMSYSEAARFLGKSRTTLVEDLKFAKAWLRKAMTP
jgi:RNA polymerase sigma factor (TIGR02999 family)